MPARGDDPRQPEAAETHAAHEGAEQNAERDRRRSDYELQQLKPDDLVDERGAAAADEQQKERRKIAASVHNGDGGKYTGGDPGRVMADGNPRATGLAWRVTCLAG